MGTNKDTKKINYYDVSMEEIKSFQKEGKKPTIAVHACCGPCACYPLVFLAEYFSRIIVLYVNPNIYPKEEYLRRKDELIRYIKGFNKEHGDIVEFVEFEYDKDPYNDIFKEYGNEREGGSRCHACYKYRMEKGYDYADSIGVDYYATIMTISRQKSSLVMNQIGEELEKTHKAKYFYSDFKKQNGLQKGVEIRKKYEMYNQQYCGCEYSYDDYLERIKLKKEEK